MRKDFWEKYPLTELNHKEWEALCDGCGKCCLLKLEDEALNEYVFSRIVCQLFDAEKCQCGDYANRKTLVPDCVILTPDNINQIAEWMPATCAYKLLHQGKPLPDWHLLVTGDPDSVHKAAESVKGWTVSETEVEDHEIETYLIEGIV